ncbi:MAG: signal peptide peptidase SppA [Muribaculaceae bacterium]
MVKKFFISMLGSMAGFWISIALLGLVGFSMLVSLFASSIGSEQIIVKDDSVLYIDLSGEVVERYQPSDPWTMLQQGSNTGEALVDILRAIREAKNDDHIIGIYINAAGVSIGRASVEEIIDALRDFKDSGKWVIAYGDSYSQTDYLIASLADAVYLNPIGGVDIHGLSVEVPHFKNLLDKLQVKMQVIRVGEYKSAVEPYILTDMSQPARRQMQVMLDSVWGYERGVMAEARSLAVGDVNTWIDSMITCRPTRFSIDNKVVDSLLYRRQVEDLLRERCDLSEDDDLPLITPTQYVSTLSNANSSKNHIAVLFACGDIVDSGNGGIVGADMVPEIIALADDDNVQAMVLRVNSGGGSAFASEQIWEALEYFKSKGKKLYVSMGDYAASGGYYISCGADRIYADHSTLTGSIGVFGMIPDLSGLMNNHLGINYTEVKTSPNGFGLSTNRPMTDAERDAMQRHVNEVYDLFTSRVATCRDIPQDSVKAIGGGRVWAGGDGVRLGLVDQIGTLNDAIKDLAVEINIEPDKVVFYPNVEEDFMQKLARQAADNMQINGYTVDAGTLQLLQFVDYLRTMSPIQARMEPFIIR